MAHLVDMGYLQAQLSLVSSLVQVENIIINSELFKKLKVSMKKILYFLIAFVLIIGCAQGQNKEDLNKLRDSLDHIVFEGTLNNDTIRFGKALELSDYLLGVDTTNINKRHYYHQRSIIFSSLGRMDEAMANAGYAVQTLHENNPLRLTFFAIKYLKEHNKDSADYYIGKTIAVCDSSLNVAYNEDMAINKIKAIYLRDGDKKAKAYLSGLLKKHPDSPLLKSLDEDWEEWVRMNNEELRLLDIEIVRSGLDGKRPCGEKYTNKP